MGGAVAALVARGGSRGGVEQRVLDLGNPPDWEVRPGWWEPRPQMWEKPRNAVKTKRGGLAKGGRCGEQGGS